jgi:DNA-directed RNA polymerase beta subunit
MKKIIKKDVDSNVEITDIKKALKSDIITRGLKTALATGNWGKDKQGDTVKTGVA